MKKIKTTLACVAILGVTSSAIASQMLVFSPDASTGYVGLNAAGVNLENTGETWTFSIGTFSSDPASLGFGNWTSEFNAFTSVDWITNPPFLAGKFESSFGMTDASFTGSQGYIWGYNSQAIDANTEWVLVTNSSWVFPEYDSLSTAPTPQNTWDFSNPDNTFIVGGALDSGFQAQVIPEPSTYALIFGLGILGFLGYRRVRK